MNNETFDSNAAVEEYAAAHGLVVVWQGTRTFAKWQRTLPPDQFMIRPVRTSKGTNNVGLFSKAILLDRPY